MWYFVLVESSRGDCVVACLPAESTATDIRIRMEDIDRPSRKVGRITTKRECDKYTIPIVGLMLTIISSSYATGMLIR